MEMQKYIFIITIIAFQTFKDQYKNDTLLPFE